MSRDFANVDHLRFATDTTLHTQPLQRYELKKKKLHAKI